MPVALIYARASSDPDDLRISVDRQVKVCAARSDELAPGVPQLVFRDDGITAADPDVVRPGYEAFLRELRAQPRGEVVLVIANEQSRFTRVPEVWEQLMVAVNRAGLAEVQTVTRGPVGVAEGNRLFGRFMALVDADEAERTRVRVQGAMKNMFEEGRPTGRPPYGLRSAERVAVGGGRTRAAWEHHPDQAPVVRDIFRWALEGVAMSTIADKLNAEGIVPRTSTWKRAAKAWSYTSVKSVLTAPSMAGLRGHTDAEGVLHTRPAQWPAIVSESDFYAVQRMLGRPTTVTGVNGQTYRVRTRPAPRPREYLLSGGARAGETYGVLRCSHCDAPLVAQTQGRRDGSRVAAYACHPKSRHPGACGRLSISPAQELEQTVVEAVQARLALSAPLRALLTASDNAEVARLRAEKDKAKADMLDAARLRGADEIDADVFAELHGGAKRRFQVATARLDAVAADGGAKLPTLEEVTEDWESLTLGQKRVVIDRLVERIVIAPAAGGRPGLDESRIGEPVWRA